MSPPIYQRLTRRTTTTSLNDSLSMLISKKSCFRYVKYLQTILICVVVLCRPCLIAAQALSDEKLGHGTPAVIADSSLSLVQVARRRDPATGARNLSLQWVGIPKAPILRISPKDGARFRSVCLVNVPSDSKHPSILSPRAPPVGA